MAKIVETAVGGSTRQVELSRCRKASRESGSVEVGLVAVQCAWDDVQAW